MTTLKQDLLKAVILGLFVGLVLLIALYNFIANFVVKQEIKKARLEADTIIYYRHYLSSIASKIEVIDNSLHPFATTPAYVTNQVAKVLRETKNIYIKQVSDNPRNIEDKADEFELKAIEFFKTNKNKKEFFEIHSPDKVLDKKHIFYARALKVEKSCLKCHGNPKTDVPPYLYKKIYALYGDRAFNYKLGDIRGILAIAFPYEEVIEEHRKI